MKSLYRSIFLFVFAGLALSSGAQADDFKVGLVSIDRILRDATPAKAAEAKLKQEFARRDKELADLGEALKVASDKFDRDAPNLTEAQRSQRQKQLIDQDRDFQRKRREVQEDANSRKNEELQQVIDRANKVVRQIAETEKYDLILEQVVYINPKHDITDKVIKALNASR